MNDEELAKRGAEARQLVASPIVGEAFADIESAYLQQALDCAPEDDLGRFRLLEGIRVSRLVKNALNQYAESGKVSAQYIADAESLNGEDHDIA